MFLNITNMGIILYFLSQLAVEYESNAVIVKVDTDDEYEFARDMQVISLSYISIFFPLPSIKCYVLHPIFNKKVPSFIIN